MRRSFSTRNVFARRLRCEPLEDRRLLSVAGSSEALEVFHTQDALFAENAGQWPTDDVYFGYNKGGTQIYFTDNSLEFGLSRRELKDEGKGDWLHLPEGPEGGAAQMVPVPFSPGNVYEDGFVAKLNDESANLPPTADAGGPYTVDEGSSVMLSASGSSDPDGSIVSYEWDLDDDGQYDDATGVTTSFSRTLDAIYTVGVKVTDDDDDFDTDSTTITVNNVAPTADAGGPYVVIEGSSVTLSAAGSTDPGNDIVSYEWDLDNDGQYDDDSGVTVNYDAPTAGTFTVAVRVTDDDGAWDVDSAHVNVIDIIIHNVTADAGGPYTVDEGSTVTLDASGSSDSLDHSISYEWDLDDDGQYDDASGVTVSFSRTEDGTYTVRVKVTCDDGAEDTDTATVTVNNVAPTADAGGPYTGFPNSLIQLSAAGSTDPGNDITTYLWDLDNDGQYDDASSVTTNFSCGGEDSYTVGVKVIDDAGAWDVDSAQITIDYYRLPGDANQDGIVDEDDSVRIAANWLGEGGWADGDFNGDGWVNDIDATIMATNWTTWATFSSAAIAPEVEPQVVTAAVSYDLDNDGQIGLGDLAHFASVYREKPGITTDSPYAYAADFDRSGTVDLGDLAFFAANYRLGRPDSSAVPMAASTVAAAPASLPGDANRDGVVDDDDAASLATNWQKSSGATWSQGDFNGDGRVSDADATILAQYWMMSVEDLDKEDDARRAVFAAEGAWGDLLGLLDE